MTLRRSPGGAQGQFRLLLITFVIVGLLATAAASPASASIPTTAPPSTCTLGTGLRSTMLNAGEGGMQYFFTLVYVNSGTTACSLSGVPGVQPVAGSDHAHVGRPSDRGGRPHGFVVLKPKGGAAHTNLFVWDVRAVECHPGSWNGVIVHLRGVQVFFLKRPAGLPPAVCANRRGSTITPVTRGADG